MSRTRRRSYNPNAPYLATCRCCGRATSKRYANSHGGQCKRCASFDPGSTREQRVLEHGWQAYAREEGHYDNES
jgi:hypothetical protein